MDCKKLQHKIDELYLEKGVKLSLQEQKHINDCDECSFYYTEASETYHLLHKIQQWEPVLDKPEELTDLIMSSIAKQSQKAAIISINYRNIVRILAAAVVALFFTLGTEQYMVLSKVQQLESRISKVQNTPHQQERHAINKVTLANAEFFFNSEHHGFSLAKASALFGLKSIKNSNFTFSDLQRYMNKGGSIKPAFNKSSH